MEFKDLKVGRIYRTKKPKFDGLFQPLVKDRQILYIGTAKQPVKKGKNYQYTKEYLDWFEKNKQPFEVKSEELIQMRFENETKLSCIEWDYIIQYDTPGGFGKSYPRAYANDFLKWVAEDVTDKLPKGEWATAL